MDERESWRPKIFYSDPGPDQGLPEPFPAPTHIRRKERSSFNRGALFVPGVGRGLGSPTAVASNRRPQNDDHRSHNPRYTERRPNVEDTNVTRYPRAPNASMRRRPNVERTE